MNMTKLMMGAVGAIFMAIAVSQGQPLGIGSPMPLINEKLTDVDGNMATLANNRGKVGTLVVFTCNHCPFVKAWQTRMVKIANDCMKRDIGVVFVNSNDPIAIPEDALEPMKNLAKTQGYTFPYVMDGSSELARAFGASRTPEAFLFDRASKLVYHGTIDDNTYDAMAVKKSYLKDAVEALLAGKAIPQADTKSVGCSIKFRAQTLK